MLPRVSSPFFLLNCFWRSVDVDCSGNKYFCQTRAAIAVAFCAGGGFTGRKDASERVGWFELRGFLLAAVFLFGSRVLWMGVCWRRRDSHEHREKTSWFLTVHATASCALRDPFSARIRRRRLPQYAGSTSPVLRLSLIRRRSEVACSSSLHHRSHSHLRYMNLPTPILEAFRSS